MQQYEELNREWDDCMAMMPPPEANLIICETCGKPCGIVHDLEISACCLGKITVQREGGSTNAE